MIHVTGGLCLPITHVIIPKNIQLKWLFPLPLDDSKSLFLGKWLEITNHPLRKMAVYQDTDPQMPDSTSLVHEKARLPNINCAVYRAELFFVAWRGNKN